ncbi:cation-translocating P-type ATPase [Levilinea saccharolytica]|uniref:ATPase n=1 Tax=Levilinea saccharolytica TaxID=229921 RepID=A0A0N8GQE9_9CHLR|nr:cation-translocating P-type ATPase [Levilinea saccharolytica]KPL83506.1 ATPase [Levilinea saccharolytica]GAP18295.1 ATPase, P-type (transporting), HAD superfamily, subfamily IC [Levilinea saccharolytica]
MKENGAQQWHEMDLPKFEQTMEVNTQQGLSADEVQHRQAQYGPNELIDRGTKSPWKILLEQLSGVMVIILIVSAVISALLGEYKDAVVILIIVILNSILGFTQEYRAEQAMAALKKMAVPHVRVRRSGHVQEISARDLVPGDVILLEAGSSIPADSRVIESVNLRVQEAVLTGESEAVEKHTDPLKGENLALGDRRNMLYMGTVATYGRGTAVVTSTGMHTELGRIAEMIQNVGQEQTPLQRRLEQLGRGLAIAALAIVFVVFILGLLRGEPLRLMFQTAISMAVAAVPEGLPAVVTIALALGAQRMLSRHALIRKLPAVETLGSVTVICSDKTGTLTENRMTVTVLDVAGNQMDFVEQVKSFTPHMDTKASPAPLVQENSAVALLLTGGTLCNDAILEEDTQAGDLSAIGDPTEGALVIAAARVGLRKPDLEAVMPRAAEVPFDSDRKRMTTLHRFQISQLPEALQPLWNARALAAQSEAVLTVTKGAVDGLLEVSSRVWVDGRIEQLNDHWKERVQAANNAMAQKGMRVLGVAVHMDAQVPTDVSAEGVEKDLIFIGMTGMIDPARPEVKDAVAVAKGAGIRPIMITGDHPLTALSIAKELGIATQHRVVTGQELAVMSDEELRAQVDDISVYARVSPEHKLKIVQALQFKGHIVAMTGDGVNDAPALKRADIGVAMGITGTDVSKEASDMILLDDNFATIVAAVEEGRRIYDNIRKFIRYTMTSNAGEIWVMLVAPFLGMPMPLTPLQILWINLVTDGLPGLALTVEPTERNTMKRKPHHPQENIFGRGMAREILWVGLLMGLVSLAMGYIFFKQEVAAWQTMVFTTLTLAQMGHVLAIRTERDSLFQVGLLSNKPLLGAVLLTFVLQMMVIYLPFFQDIFQTIALTPSQLIISLVSSTVVFFSLEIMKAIQRRKED